MFLVVAFSVNLDRMLRAGETLRRHGSRDRDVGRLRLRIGAVVSDRQTPARHPPVRLAGRLEQDPERPAPDLIGGIMLEKKVFFCVPKGTSVYSGLCPVWNGLCPLWNVLTGPITPGANQFAQPTTNQSALLMKKGCEAYSQLARNLFHQRLSSL